jgi:hypothetical protein
MNALTKAQEIENDLRTLCVEFGRVFPDVKQVRVQSDRRESAPCECSLDVDSF